MSNNASEDALWVLSNKIAERFSELFPELAEHKSLQAIDLMAAEIKDLRKEIDTERFITTTTSITRFRPAQAVNLMWSEIAALRSQRAELQEQIIQLEQDKREREILAAERRRQ